MFQNMSFQQFLATYPDNDTCLREIVRIRYPKGIYCTHCKEYVTHYRIKDRPAYSCKKCRNHVHPLVGTIFEKTTISLRLWFYAMYLLTQTHGSLTVKQLQRELGVTYKSAWRMHKRIKKLMRQNNGDLLAHNQDEETKNKVHKWVFFKRFEISVSEGEAE